MCGIAGFKDTSVRSGSQREAVLASMASAIGHRGPDDQSLWFDTRSEIGFAHRRLAIIDLSPAGRQPMTSASGRWTIVYNGEIYNFEEMRRELQAGGVSINWRGRSDSEVLVEAINHWGIERAVKATVGMFAFAAWDEDNRSLYLARDRAGEKPLYFGFGHGETFLFGSELKALRSHPAFDASIDRQAVTEYLRYSYVPAPRSIYQKIQKLPPATIARLNAHNELRLESYWEAPVFGRPSTHLDRATSLNRLEDLLSEAIRLQMRSDVPMGAFLSGGIDSSLIVSLMRQHAGKPVKTFSIGFNESAYDESAHAAAVARHLGTEHQEMHVTPENAREVIPTLSEIYDEPFADSSQIPTTLLSRLTRQHVTVALSGDAGDELFGGYARYLQAGKAARAWNLVPAAARRTVGHCLDAFPVALWDALGQIVPNRYATVLRQGRMSKVAAVLAEPDLPAVYRRLISQWPEPWLLTGSEEVIGLVDDPQLRAATTSLVAWMMTVDFRTYLPDDILAKVDRASMAASLETRVPFLDHRIVEFAASLPSDFNINGGRGKAMLRSLLYRHVPPSLIERPKQGFGVPIGDWLRGPLRDWAEDLLSPSEIAKTGLVDPGPVQVAWRRHLSRKENLQNKLWTILMLQAWQRSQASSLQKAA